MREVIRGAVSPQRKAISINDRLGNRGIKKQQGTTRILFDSLLIDGSLIFPFFEGANNRDFPDTNVGARGNQLGVGETLVFERAYLAVVETLALGGFVVTPLTVAAFPGIAMGEINLEIANSQVLKPIPLMSFFPEFNKSSESTTNTNFEFDTQIILPPLLEFVSTVRIPFLDPITDTRLRLTFEGVGAIISPRRPF